MIDAEQGARVHNQDDQIENPAPPAAPLMPRPAAEAAIARQHRQGGHPEPSSRHCRADQSSLQDPSSHPLHRQRTMDAASVDQAVADPGDSEKSAQLAVETSAQLAAETSAELAAETSAELAAETSAEPEYVSWQLWSRLETISRDIHCNTIANVISMQGTHTHDARMQKFTSDTHIQVIHAYT